VPGPQVPLYFAGAKLASFFPVSIPGHGIALNITVQSYNGLLEVGLTACRRAMPDVTDLADYIVEEHRTLRALVEALPAAEPAMVAATAAAPERAPARRPRAKAAVAAPTPKAPARRRNGSAVPAAGAKRARKTAAAEARGA